MEIEEINESNESNEINESVGIKEWQGVPRTATE